MVQTSHHALCPAGLRAQYPGKTLKARAGSWSPTPTKTSYKWLANGKSIRKATKAKLRLTPSLRGKRISVKITLRANGITTRTVTVKVSGKVR